MENIIKIIKIQAIGQSENQFRLFKFCSIKWFYQIQQWRVFFNQEQKHIN